MRETRLPMCEIPTITSGPDTWPLIDLPYMTQGFDLTEAGKAELARRYGTPTVRQIPEA